MTRVNGNLIFLLKKRILADHGEEFFKKLVEKTDPEVHEILNNPIFSDQFYDLKIFQDLLQRFYESTSKEELIKEGEKNAERQLRGFFGFVISMVSISFVINNLNKLWEKVYDGGNIEVIKNDPGDYCIKIIDFSFNEAHMISFEAYIRRGAELLSKKEFNSRIESIDDRTTKLCLWSSKPAKKQSNSE